MARAERVKEQQLKERLPPQPQLQLQPQPEEKATDEGGFRSGDLDINVLNF